jgi:hypothetical protein
MQPRSRQWGLAALVLVYVLSRLPFIPLGYGADSDAWQVARVAASFRGTGVYSASRLPGYPLFEILNSVLVTFGGWYASNTATVLASLILLLAFVKIVVRLEARYPRWLIFLFAFFPLFWINSANTMDYLWALLFVMLSWLFLLNGRVGLGALFLGLSMGFRLTSCLFIIPYSGYLFLTGRKNHIVPLVAIATVVGVASFSPSLTAHGLGTFTFLMSPYHEPSHIPYYAMYSLGIVSTLLLLYWVSRQWRPLWQGWRSKDPIVITCIVAVALVAVVFCIAPLDKSYLIPLFPFLFILLDKYAVPKLLAAFTITAVLYGFVMIEVKDTESLDEIRVRPHIDYGLVVKDFFERKEQLELREKLVPFLVEEYGRERKVLFVTGWRTGIPQLLGNPRVAERSLAESADAIFGVVGSNIDILPGPIGEGQYKDFLTSYGGIVFLEGAVRYSKQYRDFDIPPDGLDIIRVADILERT